MTAADVAERIAASRTAQAAWASLSWKERSRRLAAVERYIGKNADMLAESISRDNGKTRLDALATEVLPAVMALRYYRTKGRRFIASRRIPGGSILMFNKRSRLIYEPYGVVGIISPWNYPFAIPFAEVVMALLAGNGVLLKVASDTLDTGKNLERVFASAELPDGLFSYCELPGREAGPAFIDGGVDKLFFTGSTEVGRELMARAAPRLLPLVLELGGADAAIVRHDADLPTSTARLRVSCGPASRMQASPAAASSAFLSINGYMPNSSKNSPPASGNCGSATAWTGIATWVLFARRGRKKPSAPRYKPVSPRVRTSMHEAPAATLTVPERACPPSCSPASPTAWLS